MTWGRVPVIVRAVLAGLAPTPAKFLAGYPPPMRAIAARRSGWTT